MSQSGRITTVCSGCEPAVQVSSNSCVTGACRPPLMVVVGHYTRNAIRTRTGVPAERGTARAFVAVVPMVCSVWFFPRSGCHAVEHASPPRPDDR